MVTAMVCSSHYGKQPSKILIDKRHCVKSQVFNMDVFIFLKTYIKSANIQYHLFFKIKSCVSIF